MKNTLLLLFLMYWSMILHGQDFIVKHYDNNDGMTNGPKRCMVQDRDGFLWIGSTSGINRFDGKNFKIYTGSVSDSTNFDAYHFKSLDIDEEGNLWACLMEGIFIYDKDQDRFVKRSNNMKRVHDNPVPAFTDLIFIKDRLYITSFVGLHIFDPKEDTWEYIDLTPGVKFEGWHTSPKSIWHLSQDIYDPNILHIFGKSNYYKYDIGSKTVLERITISNKYNRTSTIVQSKQIDQDRFWLSSFGNGFILFNRNTKETEYQLLDEKYAMEVPIMVIWDFLKLDNGSYLLSNLKEESILFDPKSKEWKSFKLEGMKDKYFSIIKDTNGTIWMAGKTGLTKLSKKQFDIVDIPKMNKTEKHGIQVASNGKYAIVMYPGPIHQLYDIDKKGKFVSKGTIKDGKCPKYEKNGDFFYYQNKNNLLIFDPVLNKNTDTIHLEKGFDFEFLRSYKDLIFTVKDAKVKMHHKNGAYIKEWNLEDIGIKISPLVKDQVTIKNDSILYFHNSTEIVEINSSTDVMKRITLPSDKMVIMDLFIVNNDLWIPNKLNTLIKLEWDTVTKEFISKNIFEYDHLENVGTCTMDSTGIIWICTYNGLKAIDTHTGKTIYNIDGRDGLNDINDKIHVTKSGIYLNSGDDIIKINEAYSTPKMGKLLLNEIVIKGKKQPINKSYQLKYDENDISINWQLPYLGRYDQLSFYFKLEGHQEEWHYNQNHTSAYFSTLPPGDYSFKLKAICLGEEIMTELFHLSIAPPWWKTLWFYIISGIVLLFSVYKGYKNRIAKVTRKARIAKKISQLEIKALRAQLNPHFIFNSLNSVKSLILLDEKEQAIEYLVLFAAMIRRVLDMSDKESVSLQEEIEFSEEYLRMESMRLGKQFSYHINIDSQIDLDFILVPPMILQPHLENAIWHGLMLLKDKTGHIDINIRDRGDHILIQLDDNGIGRAASEKINQSNTNYKHNPKGTSLSIDRIKLRSLVKEQKINIDIEDKIQDGKIAGTSVLISLIN